MLWGGVSIVSAQVQLTSTNLTTPYTQDFNTLATTGTTNALSTLPTGWRAANVPGTNYSASTGNLSGFTGRDLFSFGAANASDRALGSWNSLFGSTIYFGANFQNTTGTTLTYFTLSFTVENYSASGATASDPLTLQYIFAPATQSFTSATGWTTLSSTLNATTGPAFFSFTTGINWASGSTNLLWLRWSDSDVLLANDRALAIDNLMVAVPEPAAYGLVLGAAALGCVGYRRWRKAKAVA